MKNLVILGAGTAGTIMAAHLRKKLSKQDWTVRIVDRARDHYYQPGYLFMPFGIYSGNEVSRPMKRTIPRGVDYHEADVDRIDAESNRVYLQDGAVIPYDILIIATGVHPAPDQVRGLSPLREWKHLTRAFPVQATAPMADDHADDGSTDQHLE